MAYKTVDLRGRLPGSAASNIGSQQKTPGRFIVHYSGADFPGDDMYDRLRHGRTTVLDVLASEARSHMVPGRFDPGFAVNGIQYHVTVWRDTVYICRNLDAKLWHCGDGVSSTSYNYSALAVHVPTTKGFPVDARTLQTLAEWIADRMRMQGASSRANVKGHMEVGATECPGQLMSQFVYPFRAGKIKGDHDQAVPKNQGGGDGRDIPVDGTMTRWEFGQVDPEDLRREGMIDILYDGDHLWDFVSASSPIINYEGVPNIPRYEFMRRPVEDLPPKFEVTFDGRKFGVVTEVGGNPGGKNGPAPKPMSSRARVQPMQQHVGGRYTPWFESMGKFLDGPPAWRSNGPAPAPSLVRTKGGFCAYVLNMLCRYHDHDILNDSPNWWAGGIAWWFEYLEKNGMLKKLDPKKPLSGYPDLTVFIADYEGPEIDRQGHTGVKWGKVLFQSDTGLGINTSRTLASTLATVSRFTHYALPGDVLGKKYVK